MVDDCDRFVSIVELTGSAFATRSNILNQQGHLEANTEARGLGLTFSLFLILSHGQEGYGNDKAELEWRPLLIAHVKRDGMDCQGQRLRPKGRCATTVRGCC